MLCCGNAVKPGIITLPLPVELHNSTLKLASRTCTHNHQRLPPTHTLSSIDGHFSHPPYFFWASLVRSADIRCVELLLAFGADPDAAHEEVGSAFDFAAHGGRVASFLNATRGWPPLQIAVDRTLCPPTPEQGVSLRGFVFAAAR